MPENLANRQAFGYLSTYCQVFSAQFFLRRQFFWGASQKVTIYTKTDVRISNCTNCTNCTNDHAFLTLCRIRFLCIDVSSQRALISLDIYSLWFLFRKYATISGLQAATTYHYCLYASNPIGTGWGEDKTFTTYPQVPYTYISANGKITITDYTGPGTVVNIPSTINGLPVTTIGSFAFYNRGDLTSITLPASVTSIEDFAFYSCTGLTNMTLPVGLISIGDFAFYDCSSLTGITIPGGVIDIGSYAFALCESLASVRITNGVLSIGEGTFYGCAQLSQVTIPASITSIGQSAFAYCSALLQASFTGNAPAMGKSVFDGSASGFTVDYFGDKAGFTSPKWLGYATFSMVAGTPFATWLVEKSLPYNANPLDDPNDDGVNLLLAYALNLDPQRNLSASMPQPLLVAGHLSLRYYTGSAGVTYAVQTSTDLLSWTPDGVTVSGPDTSHVRTATANLPGSKRFLRLVVTAP